MPSHVTGPSQVTGVAVDDALTSIYRLSHDEGIPVIAARLAERLGISGAAMSASLRRLARDGLVTTTARREVALTEAGAARARQMIRRHRLAECFLIDVLRLEWWRAYEEAHLLEHAISDVTEPLLVALLDAPATSPFGYPIPDKAPTSRGDEALIPRRTLHDLAPGDVGVVNRVFEEDAELLRFFDVHGIWPGTRVEVLSRSASLRMVTVCVDGRETVFSSPVAGKIWIEDTR